MFKLRDKSAKPMFRPATAALSWKNEKGFPVQEYIPPLLSAPEMWLHGKYLSYRMKKGKDIYYWHVRYMHSPELRKMYDIAFIMHCVKDHESEPTDEQEAKWFRKLWNLYGVELVYMGQEMVKDPPQAWKTEKIFNGDPYAYAYQLKWLNPLGIVAQSKTLYHGISVGDYLELYDQEQTQAKKLFAAYLKRHKARVRKMYKDRPAAEPETTEQNEPEPAPTESKIVTSPKQQRISALKHGTAINFMVFFVAFVGFAPFADETFPVADVAMVSILSFLFFEAIIMAVIVLHAGVSWIIAKIRSS